MENQTAPSQNAIPAKRIEWIDALRALAVFFVILGHQLSGKTAYFVFTSPIKIPLFFMITGYVFNYQRRSVDAFFKNLLLKLVVPWLCLTVPVILLRPQFWGFPSIPAGLYGIISGAVQWYMPCCILAEIIWFFVNRYGKKTRRVIIFSLAVFLAGIAAASFGYLNFGMLNRAMIAQFFILLGYLFRQYQDRLANLKKMSLLLLSFGYVLMGLVSLKLWPGSCIDVHMNIYYNYPFCFLMITLGGLTLFSAGKAIFEKGQNSLPRFVLFAGQNTIVFYLLHSFNIAALVKMLSLLHIQIPFYPFAIIKTAFALFTCSIESLILIRFFPWVIGRGSTKTKNKGSIMK